jgi:hypothetical protein
MEEMEKILPFKEAFISSTREERMSILKDDILPALFNYWQDEGEEYTPRESKALTKV